MCIRYRVADRIGFRGLFLTMFGLMFFVIGLGVLANPAPDPYLWHTQLPIWFRLTIWGGAGLAAVCAAWQPRLQPVGFAALFVGPAERFVSFTGAMLLEPSFARLTGAALYLLLTLTVVLIASWPEPATRLR